MYSKEDWRRWVTDYLIELKVVYDNSPKRVKEDYGNEAKVSSDYKGRAILELLQNSDDAQIPEREVTDKIGPPEIYFVLKDTTLYCANGGHQVSMEGFDAICRLSHSPKEVKDKKRATIGEKGLGFKSVLSFSETPEIHSGNLHCFFSRKKSYEFISKTSQFETISGEVREKHVPLLRIPNIIPDEEWKSDNILVDLLKTYSTVVKLPLTIGLKDVEIDDELAHIEPTILLFLRRLDKITIQRMGDTYSFRIVRGDTIKLDENTDVIQCSILNDSPTDWSVVKHLETIPPDKLIGLGEGWEEMDTCCVSFAIQGKNGDYVPIPAQTRNRIRVYFPTDEDFYIPVLFHATFHTDTSRKTINPKILYNSFVVSEGVKAFLKYVLKYVSARNKFDPGGHLDFLATSIDPKELIGGKEVDDNIGKMFIRGIYKEVIKHSIIPTVNGVLYPPETPQILGRSVNEWDDWYELLGEEVCTKLALIHLCCKKENRFRLIEYLNPNKISNKNLTENLNAVADKSKTVEWCANVYLLLCKLHSEVSPWENKELEVIYKKLKIIKLSDGTLTSNDENYKVFMPSSSTTNVLPPNWLKIKFVHPDLISLLQSKTTENSRERIFAKYLDYFGVKLYRARDIIRECVTNDLSSYWDGKETEVNPQELLCFLFNLQKDELRLGDTPEPEIEEYVRRIPVPSFDQSMNDVWSPAGETYASADWTGNEILESLYHFDKNSRFLRKRDYFNDSSNKWEIFLKWLGISWVPRVIRLTTRMKYYHIPKPEVSQNLLSWSDYSSTIEKIQYDEGGGTINDGRISIKADYVLDRFFEMCEDPKRQKILLNLLADTPSLIDNIPKAMISFIPYKNSLEQTKTLEINYQEWCLRNTAWLCGLGFSKRFKPFELCIKGGLYAVLEGYACYVDYKTEINPTEWKKMKSFLIRIGLSDSLEDFSLSQWYSILTTISRDSRTIKENESQKIRAVYRHFVRTHLVPETDEDRKLKEVFMENGKVLSSQGGKYLFAPPSETFYIDKLNLLPKFEKYVPCFQVEPKRDKRVRELFGINSLSECLEIDPEFGSLEKGLFDMLNNFFEHSKPFLLARIRSQRIDKIDSRKLSKTEIRPVRIIKVRYGLKNNGTVNWVYDGEEDSLVYHNGSGESLSIFVNARLIQKSIESSEDFSKEDVLIQEIANRVAELLDTDLSEAFQLIMSKDDATRVSLLKNSGVTEEILSECKVEINEPVEDISVDMPKELFKPVAVDTQSNESPPTLVQRKTMESTDRKIWGFDDNESFNFSSIEPPVPLKEKDGKGGGVGGHAAHPQDPDIRKRTDMAGMNITKNFERKNGYCPNDVSTLHQRLDRGEGPGCDINSFDKNGKLIRRIEVKSSLGDFTTLDFTKTEWEISRNQFTGETFYLYRVSKLDAKRYPDGPELLIIQDPYGKELEGFPSGYTVKIDPIKGKLIKISPIKDGDEQPSEKDIEVSP